MFSITNLNQMISVLPWHIVFILYVMGNSGMNFFYVIFLKLKNRLRSLQCTNKRIVSNLKILYFLFSPLRFCPLSRFSDNLTDLIFR